MQNSAIFQQTYLNPHNINPQVFSSIINIAMRKKTKQYVGRMFRTYKNNNIKKMAFAITASDNYEKIFLFSYFLFILALSTAFGIQE